MERRRATEEIPSYILKSPIFETTPNYKDQDFSDVFGGPPRTLHLSRTNFFYQDHNLDSTFAARSARTDEYEYDDDVRFRSCWSTNSKSSSGDFSPSYSFSASNSRPVSAAGRWSPKPAKQKSKHFPFNGKQSSNRKCDVNERMMRMMMSSSNFSFSRRVSSPERDVGDLDSLTYLKQVVENYELCSTPSSVKSSVCQEEEVVVQSRNEEDCLTLDDDDDIMSSYVIEINDFKCDDPREETVGVDEAIAWAKEQYRSGIQLEKYHPGSEESGSSQMDEDMVSSSLGSDSIRSTAGIDEEQKAMELVDEGIKLWSAYKETNIQLLLSTLHHILWSSSGWTVVSLVDIIDSSQVKKAYQKARLCLHPDKLQQRGATPLQKYVAAEAFSILQGAWEAFTSRNSF